MYRSAWSFLHQFTLIIIILIQLSVLMLVCLFVSGTIPYDGVPRKEIVTVYPAVPAVCITLGCVGIAFAIACLIFNFIFRNAKYV